jgi:hypothetical protein
MSDVLTVGELLVEFMAEHEVVAARAADLCQAAESVGPREPAVLHHRHRGAGPGRSARRPSRVGRPPRRRPAPSAFQAIRNGQLRNEPLSIIRHRIQEVLGMYARACGMSQP